MLVGLKSNMVCKRDKSYQDLTTLMPGNSQAGLGTLKVVESKLELESLKLGDSKLELESSKENQSLPESSNQTVDEESLEHSVNKLPSCEIRGHQKMQGPHVIVRGKESPKGIELLVKFSNKKPAHCKLHDMWQDYPEEVKECRDEHCLNDECCFKKSCVRCAGKANIKISASSHASSNELVACKFSCRT